jgi:hypothetical protein
LSNVNNPHGLRPLMRTQSGGGVQTEPWAKAVGYAYAIYKWDPVTSLAGVLNGPASGITPGTTRYLGVSLTWSIASVAATHLVLVDPGDLFEAQGDGSDAALAVTGSTDYNANLNLTGTAGGGVTRDNSGVQITETTIAVTSSLDVKLLGMLNEIDNAFGAYCRWELRFNKHLRNPEVTAT